MDRAREPVIEDEEFDDLFRRDVAVALAVHFEGACQVQHCSSLDVVQEIPTSVTEDNKCSCLIALRIHRNEQCQHGEHPID